MNLYVPLCTFYVPFMYDKTLGTQGLCMICMIFEYQS